MVKSKKLARFLLVLFILQILFFASSASAVAKADDLIIDDNGEVTLVVTGNSVLATTTDVTTSTPTPVPTSAPNAPAPTPKTVSVPKVVPVAPPNSQSKVKISPNQTGDKKIRITVETTTPTKTGQNAAPTAPTTKPTQTAPGGTAPTTTPAPANVQTVEKTVDNVILRGADKQPVLSIKPDQNQNNQVNIQQQNVNVSTNLPLQIDTKTHIISVQTIAGTQQVSVLPDQAVKGAEQKVANGNLQVTKSDVSLTSERGQAVYTVTQEKKGKLLGAFDITLPSSVKISAQTGKTISVWQSPVSLVLGFLIR